MVYWYTIDEIGTDDEDNVVVIKHEHLASFKTKKEAEDYIKKLGNSSLIEDVINNL